MTYLYQIILCSSRPGRVWRREIAVSEVNALITAAEIMPPGYQIVLAKMRKQNEAVFHLNRPLKQMADYTGCPFCHNMNIFTCHCGAISCITADPVTHHECPNCKRVFPVKTVTDYYLSESGFIHGGRQLEGYRGEQSNLRPPDFEEEESDGTWRGLPPENPYELPAHDRKRLGEGKNPRALPPGDGPKALPPGNQKRLPPAGGSEGKARKDLQDFLKKKKK